MKKTRFISHNFEFEFGTKSITVSVSTDQSYAECRVGFRASRTHQFVTCCIQ